MSGIEWLKTPALESVKRTNWIVDYCKGKRVFHIGCADGDLHTRILRVAVDVWGVDRKETNRPQVLCADVEQGGWIPEKEFDVVVAGEIVEHLSNPGLFFEKLKRFTCPIIITVPNAYCGGRFVTLAKHGYECVHPEHVCWHSYYTLKALVERCGFEVVDAMRCFKWEDEDNFTSEGLLFIIRGING